MSDQWCMDLCKTYAERSKDKSTKLGAVIMAPLPGGQLLSGGCNSFPRGIDDHIPERQVRPEKYKWFVHAEANAVYNAARSGVCVDGGVLYCQWLPCPTCAMAIIQAGISCVVVASFTVPERWRGDMDVAVTMLGEAGVYIRLVDRRWASTEHVLNVLHGRATQMHLFEGAVELLGCAECDVPAGTACLESCTSGSA